MDKLSFSSNFIYLDGKPIGFGGRPYLPAIYAVENRNLVLRCSRQTEKSTFLVNTIIKEVCTRPNCKILFVSPRADQTRVFIRSRLLAAIEQSPLVRRTLLGKRARRPPLSNMEFDNGATLFVRSAFHTADACRGVSAQLLLVDEFQDMAPGDLPVLEETMSHAVGGRTILTGTPKSIDNHLESLFAKSTANEWTLTCSKCQKGVILDERCLTARYIACPGCGAKVSPKLGKWVPRNPDAKWGEGFWVNHLMVNWIGYGDVLRRQETYDIFKFKNEVLGLPTTLGDHVITRAEIEACCTELPMAQTAGQLPRLGGLPLICGIDWGGGGTSRTVLVLGYMRKDFKFQICRIERFAASEDPRYVLEAVAKRIKDFKVALIAADGGGNGTVLNRLLCELTQLPARLYAITYSHDREPSQDGVLWKWPIGRSDSIGLVFSRIKRRSLLFPKLSDFAPFLAEFTCEVAEYDPVMRAIKYTHPETMQDDVLHATNYALALATYVFSAPPRRSIHDFD